MRQRFLRDPQRPVQGHGLAGLIERFAVALRAVDGIKQPELLPCQLCQGLHVAAKYAGIGVVALPDAIHHIVVDLALIAAAQDALLRSDLNRNVEQIIVEQIVAHQLSVAVHALHGQPQAGLLGAEHVVFRLGIIHQAAHNGAIAQRVSRFLLHAVKVHKIAQHIETAIRGENSGCAVWGNLLLHCHLIILQLADIRQKLNLFIHPFRSRPRRDDGIHQRQIMGRETVAGVYVQLVGRKL